MLGLDDAEDTVPEPEHRNGRVDVAGLGEALIDHPELVAADLAAGTSRCGGSYRRPNRKTGSTEAGWT